MPTDSNNHYPQLGSTAEQLGLLLDKHIQLLESLAELAEVTSEPITITLPESDKVQEEVERLVTAPIKEAVENLQQQTDSLATLPEQVTEKIDALQEKLAYLETTPEILHSEFNTLEGKLNEASDTLQQLVSIELLPLWDDALGTLKKNGEDSYKQLTTQMTTNLQKFDTQIVQSIQKAIQQKFTALATIQDETERFQEKGQLLASNIQLVCDALSQSQRTVSKATSHANIGVERSVDAIESIREAIQRLLMI